MNITADDAIRIIGELTIKSRVLESERDNLITALNNANSRVQELEEKYIPKDTKTPQLVEKK